MTDEELIAKFQERVAAGEIDLRPLGELIFGKFDQDWPARLIALARTAVPALIARLEASEARNATAYAEGVEAAAKAVEAYKRDASFDDSQVGALEHNSNEENIVCAIRSLLKDKPNG